MVRPPRVDSSSHVVPRRADGSRRVLGPHIGPLRITPFRVVIAIAFLGSLAYIAYAILRVRDATQIPMLSSGFGVLGVACAAVALGVGIEMWRSARAARPGRAMALAVGGGLFGMAAIACFAAAVVFALLWGS